MSALESCDGLEGLVVCDREGFGGMAEDEVRRGRGWGDAEDVGGIWERG